MRRIRSEPNARLVAYQRRKRRAMTLLEVMIATVIVLGSVMALSRIAFLARRHAHAAEDRSLAQVHCQNITQEILAGIRPLQSVAPTVFEGEQWVYMVEVEPIEETTLARVAVTVDRLDDPEGMVPSEDELGGYRLVRWMRLGSRTISEFEGELDDGTEGEYGTELDDTMDGALDSLVE